MLFLVLLAAGFLVSCTNNEIKEATTTDISGMKDTIRDGVLIHITHASDDAHRAVMALKMATLMSENKDVLVYLDISGIELVLKNAKDFTYPTFPSVQESLRMLIDKGVAVYACPGCMKAAGKTADDLIPGVKMAEKEAFFNFTKGRILSLDY